MIRQATFRDAVRLHALILDHADFERSVASLTLAELEAILDADAVPTHILVAAVSHELVGYAAVTFDWSLWRARRYGHLDCLFVARNVRGQGIGTRLFAETVLFARAEGVDRIEWQTPSWNESAIRFYERQGAATALKARFDLILT